MTEDRSNSKYIHVTQAIPTPKGLSRVDPEVLEMASERGKRVHAKLKTYALSISDPKYYGIYIPPLDYEAEGYFISGKNWIDQYVDKIIFIEKRFVHPKYYYEGTPDLVAILKGHSNPSIIDFKTPIQYQEKEWSAQLSAYENMIQECKGIKFDQLLSVRVREKGKKALVNQVKDKNNAFLAFLNGLSVCRYYGIRNLFGG